MSKRFVLIVLGVIILLNVFVIGYVLIDRAVEEANEDEAVIAEEEPSNQEEETSTDSEAQPIDETEPTEETEQPAEDAVTADETEQPAENTETTENTGDPEQREGTITTEAAYDENETVLNAGAIAKSEANRNLMEELGKWVATNYAPEDINTTTYTVQRGDTLWEISEGYYGTGHNWKAILELNKDEVGFLPNGSQALIIPGQILVLSD